MRTSVWEKQHQQSQKICDTLRKKIFAAYMIKGANSLNMQRALRNKGALT